MANVRNVIVGAAQVFVSRGANELRPATYYKAQYYGTAPAVSWSDSQSARGWLMGTVGADQWRDVGYTNNGLEVSYEPGYGDVMVDQLLDAARLFKQSIKITLRTELAEGTLENMALAFGQPDPSLEFSASTGSITAASVLQTLTGATVTAATGYAALGLAAGALGDQPVERSIIAIGQAPEQFGSNLRTGAPTFTQTSTQSATGSAAFALLAGAALANVGSASSGSTAYGNNEAGTYGSMRERVYIARRVVQMDASTHSLKRDTGVTFPVTFRCLPDDNDVYDAAEYGVVIDRIYSVF
jgi:hypothetical protein